MPELPEVQAHAERLAAGYGGAVLEGFAGLSFTALKTFDPPPLAAVGRPLDGVGRRGKHLLLHFGDLTHVVHLMQGGRLRPDPKPARKPRGGLARWHFGGRDALLLTEAGTERSAGVWVVRGDALAQEPLAGLGPEADAVAVEELAGLLGSVSMRLHTFLRRQSLLAGLGRRLANEVCHRARLSPFAGTASLDAEAAGRIVAAIRDAVEEGLAFERALPGMSAAKERPERVHGRVGEACPECGDQVRAVAYRSYTVAYCPTCQTDGRVLADNSTSRFLR